MWPLGIKNSGQVWGHEFLDEVITTLLSIAATQLIYPQVYRERRRTLINRFPLGIYYHVDNSTIGVVAVMHGTEIRVDGKVA